jgi:C4-dicarboxylate-specific signal transduction histidine kinase
MPEAGWLCGEASCEEGVRRIGKALHDLCQPLTTLQCRLEMAQVLGTAEAYREAVEMGMAECVRLTTAIGSLRTIVRAATRQGAEEQTRLKG